MMKKEEIVEILDKHLKTLIEGEEDEWFEFEEMKTMPEYNTVLNAMLEVAEKAVNENCNLQNVSGSLFSLTDDDINKGFKKFEKENEHLDDTDHWSFENGVRYAESIHIYDNDR